MAKIESFAKGPPFALWPKLPILSTLWKYCHFSANSCYLIAFLVSLETRINSASIHTNQAQIALVLTIFQPNEVGPRMAKIESFAKAPPFALWPKLPILSTLWKYCHFSANSCYLIAFLVSLETRINSASIHTNQAQIALVLTIFQPNEVGPRKWPKSRVLQRLPPLHFGQNCPF